MAATIPEVPKEIVRLSVAVYHSQAEPQQEILHVTQVPLRPSPTVWCGQPGWCLYTLGCAVAEETRVKCSASFVETTNKPASLPQGVTSCMVVMLKGLRVRGWLGLAVWHSRDKKGWALGGLFFSTINFSFSLIWQSHSFIRNI